MKKRQREFVPFVVLTSTRTSNSSVACVSLRLFVLFNIQNFSAPILGNANELEGGGKYLEDVKLYFQVWFSLTIRLFFRKLSSIRLQDVSIAVCFTFLLNRVVGFVGIKGSGLC